jgi:hypothetical protein
MQKGDLMSCGDPGSWWLGKIADPVNLNLRFKAASKWSTGFLLLFFQHVAGNPPALTTAIMVFMPKNSVKVPFAKAIKTIKE